MVSKRDLGVSYFLGLGVGLVVSLLGYFLLVDRTVDVESAGILTALGFASSLPYLGYWLHRSDLSDAAVWAVARWCAIGVAVPTVFAGGLIAELRRQYARVDELNRRNGVLNQVMRHDIRNDVSVIEGRTELLAERASGVDEELIEPTTDGRIRIRVSDNGPGVPEEFRRAITADTTPSAASHSGLGLWLVGWFVDRYDGTIAFEDNEPRGTAVTVTLPEAPSPGDGDASTLACPV